MIYSTATSLLLVVALAGVIGAYDLDTLDARKVSLARAKTVGGLKEACSEFALEIFELLGVNDHLDDQEFEVDAAELFDKLELWASQDKEAAFDPSLVVLFDTCSSALAPRLSKAPKLPRTNIDLDMTHRFTLMHALETPNNPEPRERCLHFTGRISAGHGVVYSEDDPRLDEHSLELSLQLIKHYGNKTKKIEQIEKVLALAEQCKLVMTDVLKKKIEGLTKSQIDVTTESLIKLADPNWTPKGRLVCRAEL